jgi:hypothetical protein
LEIMDVSIFLHSLRPIDELISYQLLSCAEKVKFDISLDGFFIYTASLLYYIIL